MWCVKLNDSEREAARDALRRQAELEPSLTNVLDAFDLARWDDLPEASLPWDRVTELATVQGIGEADVVWGLAAGAGTRTAS